MQTVLKEGYPQGTPPSRTPQLSRTPRLQPPQTNAGLLAVIMSSSNFL